MAVLHPLECYLLEAFSCAKHIAATRDQVIELIDAHEAAYARLQRELDPHQRNKPLWQQADVTWGTRVLPNIRPARERYIKAYILRTHNDPSAFGGVGNTLSNWNRGISEFWDGWMTEEEKKRISLAQRVATKLDMRLGATAGGEWDEGELTYIGQGRLYQVSELPRRIPRYVLEPNVRIERGESPRQLGIYLPDIEFAAARLLYPTRFKGGVRAYQGVRRSDYVCEHTGKRAYDWKETQLTETGWTLIRRVEGEFIEVPERGFFPRGEPEELYRWPEREAQFITREGEFISGWSGEPASHSGKWSTFGRKGFEYEDLQQGQRLPYKDAQAVKWTLIKRVDGGSCIEVPQSCRTLDGPGSI
ncbi:hypothetical protein ACIQUS_14250 [Pseudomonas sp. NPDC090755]|uniref:hypothetical protein n=1 Tax=Pseudomonas sp. NPDC090755 TaxID=3364481 RepID=UPI00383B1809